MNLALSISDNTALLGGSIFFSGVIADPNRAHVNIWSVADGLQVVIGR